MIVLIMGQNCEKHVRMCFESVKQADEIIFCDGGSTDTTLKIAKEYSDKVIHNNYDQEDKQMNGKQRNFYLDYLKKHHIGEWTLVLDADEVIDDFNKLNDLVKKKGIFPLISVKMEHFIGDLGHTDNTQQTHYVLNRLFRVSNGLKYPLVEHPILSLNNKTNGISTDETTIWHLAYCPNMWDIKKRYENHLRKSNMHSPEFLKEWYLAHLFGGYPRRTINVSHIPSFILNEFGIEHDEIYFRGRKIETKHFIDAIDWKNHFKPGKVLEIGCGLGPRVFAMNNIGLNATGIEISTYAVGKTFSPGKVFYGNIVTLDPKQNKYDLIVAYDVLEHIHYNDLPKAINNIKQMALKNVLISVPVIGDPNLEADSTHRIKQTKKWWINEFISFGFKLKETPVNFQYANQLIILEV